MTARFLCAGCGVGVVTDSPRPRRYCSKACMRQAAYRRKVGDGRCPACLDPSFPGGATCAYHRRESQLRTQAWQLTRRGLSTAEVDAQRQALRARWQALRAAHVDPWLLAEAMFG